MISFEATRRVMIWFTQCSGWAKIRWWLTFLIAVTQNLARRYPYCRDCHGRRLLTLRFATETCTPRRVGKGAKRRAHAVSRRPLERWARFALPTLRFIKSASREVKFAGMADAILA